MPQKYSMSMYNVHSVKLEAEIRKICSSKEPNKKTKIIFFFLIFWMELVMQPTTHDIQIIHYALFTFLIHVFYLV